MTTKADVIVVTPHPDDAEFGVAGTVVNWVREGKKVVLVVTTNGDKGTSDPNLKPEELARIREQEQLAAARILGVSEVEFLRYPDQGLEDTPALRKDLVRMVRKYRPYTVVTVDPYRRYLFHRDHRITGQVVLDAVFPYARDHLSYPELLEEGLSPHKVRELLLWGPENPNYSTDITDTFEFKIAALSCHVSQVGGDRATGLEERLRARAAQLAQGEPYQLAEVFHRIEIGY